MKFSIQSLILRILCNNEESKKLANNKLEWFLRVFSN